MKLINTIIRIVNEEVYSPSSKKYEPGRYIAHKSNPMWRDNIDRIHQMMGVITEDRKGEVIKKMIDELGLTTTIKYFGNYYTIEPYLKEIDKVNFIKDKIREINDDGSGIGLHEINEEPLHYGDEDGELHQIEWLGLTSVDISVYEDEYSSHLRDYYVKYESLPGQILDELVEILLNH